VESVRGSTWEVQGSTFSAPPPPRPVDLIADRRRTSVLACFVRAIWLAEVLGITCIPSSGQRDAYPTMKMRRQEKQYGHVSGTWRVPALMPSARRGNRPWITPVAISMVISFLDGRTRPGSLSCRTSRFAGRCARGLPTPYPRCARVSRPRTKVDRRSPGATFYADAWRPAVGGYGGVGDPRRALGTRAERVFTANQHELRPARPGPGKGQTANAS
jgi:hypothetical protein